MDQEPSSPTPPDDAEVYEALRRVAQRMMGSERASHTLQATALVHEAWLRVAKQEDGAKTRFRDRQHFMSTAAETMRRILVDHARTRATLRRGGQRLRLTIDPSCEPAAAGRDLDLLALDECLDRLAVLDARQAKIVEYRFFGGLTLDEIASELGLGARTVDREWACAKAWLFREMTAREDNARGE